MEDYQKMFKEFYKLPGMTKIVHWKIRLGKFLEHFYSHLLKTNVGGVEGFITTLNRLPELETLSRQDRLFRSNHSWLFPSVVNTLWKTQEKEWRNEMKKPLDTEE